MKKEITIKPVNDDISTLANALRLKNTFLEMGFKTTSAFGSIMQHYMEKYKPVDQIKKLDAWWLTRLKDPQINNDVEYVIEQLKDE